MKKIYFLATILLLFLVFFNLTDNQAGESAPLFLNGSILDQEYPSGDLTSVSSVKVPKLVGEIGNINVLANSYLVIDRNTFSPILELNANEKFYIGSLTKLMTAAVALENARLSDVVMIDTDFKGIPSHRMGLFKTEEITLQNLLYGLLISSSNDAAETIALYVGGGDYNTFISMMNNKAREIGMKNTRFANAMGLDNKDNYSTTSDLSYLANYALKKPFINEAVRIEEKRVKSADSSITHYLLNTNKLLFDKELNVFGLKTGKTPWAGECLITLAKGNGGNEILAVLLGSEARFEDMRELISWVWKNVVWE